MDKLYKLARAAGGSFSCFGATFGLRTNDVSLFPVITRSLPPNTQRTSDTSVETIYSFLSPPLSSGNTRVRRFHLLYENSTLMKRGQQFSDLFDSFENAVNLHICQHAEAYSFVHAGVVAWNGLAIVIPGPSRSGKSTLVKSFLQAGADYLSDEFAVFDSGGKLHPFPRLISLRVGRESRIKVTAEQLGASTVRHPVPLGMVISTRYRRSARWKPREMSRGQTILSLLANSMSGPRAPKSKFEMLRNATYSCISLSGGRGSADQVVKTCLRKLDSHFQTVQDNLGQGERNEK